MIIHVILTTIVTTSIAFASLTPAGRFGEVYWGTSDVVPEMEMGTIYISSWQSPAVADDLSSALDALRQIKMLDVAIFREDVWITGVVVQLPECAGVDTACLEDVAGRLTPWPLSRVMPTGSWQWDKPLVIMLQDSISCELFLALRERRWTEVLVNVHPLVAMGRLHELIRRWRRERVDRLEEMFQK